MREEKSSIQINRFHIPYRAMGDGPPILCSELPLNPFAFFNPLQEQLAVNYRFVLFDLRPVVGGSGRKPPADDLLDFLSDFTVQVADALGIGAFSLMGSFMFGAVAMDAARKTPDRVSRLILFSPLGVASGPMTPMLRFILWFYRLPGIPFFMCMSPFRALVEWIDRYLIGPKRMRQIFFDPVSVNVSLEDLYDHYKSPQNAAGPALMWAIRKMRYTNLVANLNQVQQPTLIVHGAEDRWIPVDYARELRSRLPDAELIEMPKTRHAPQLENVALTAEIVEAFLKNRRKWEYEEGLLAYRLMGL
jgi:pimeloyl-ACP methyl ester carboxylesterase